MALLAHFNNQFDYLLAEDNARVRSALELTISRSGGYGRSLQTHMERVLRILNKWHAPVSVVLTYIAFSLRAARLLAEHQHPLFDEQMLAEADTLQSVHSWEPRISDPEPLRKANRAGKLRELFYLAYTNPDLALISIARHQANMLDLTTLDTPQARLTCEESREIYQPLAELFGMWELQRNLAISSIQTLFPRQVERIHAQRTEHEKKLDPIYIEMQEKLDQALAKAGLKGKTSVHFRSDIGIFRKTDEGTPIAEVMRRLRFQVELPEVDDCYRALGCIHSLWTPLQGRGKDGVYFKDLIAAPKFNLFRSLQTTVESERPELGQKIQAQFTLVTPEINKVNNMGYVYARYQHNLTHPTPQAWWEDTDLLNYVAERPLDSRSASIYVFSPTGRVFSDLPNGSICLDYAYRVHTDLGNRCKRVWVNGVPVTVFNELNNGDLLEVEIDRALKSVKPEWQKAVKTSNAIKAIKSALAPNPDERGKKRLLELFKREAELYGLKQHAKTEEFEKHVDAVAQTYSYPTTAAFYLELGMPKSASRNQRIDPNQLVAEFIHKKLAAQIARVDEKPLGVSNERVRFFQCRHESCHRRILPGVTIVGRMINAESQYPRLSVYAKDCPSAPLPPEAIPLEWLGDRRPGEAVQVKIQAVDRAKLLGDVLGLVYPLCTRGLNILQVNAQVDREHKARIELLIEAPVFSLINELSQMLKTARGVGLLDYYAIDFISPLDKRSLSQTDAISNPYRTNATADPRVFKGRDGEIGRILNGLESEQRAFTIYGFSRMGKSSLLRFLTEQVLPAKSFLPVYINLQSLTYMSENDFWQAVYERILKCLQAGGLPPSAEKKNARSANPTSAYERVLNLIADPAHKHTGKHLVLLFDEINILEESMATPNDSVKVIGALKALVESNHPVHCIFAMQAARHPRMNFSLGAAGLLSAMLRLGPEIALNHLDSKSAERLVREPLGDQIEFTPELIQNLLWLTANHPYYLQSLLYWILEYARQERIRLIDCDTLQQVLEEYLYGDTNLFNQYLPETSTIAHEVLVFLAQAGTTSPWVAANELKTQYKKQRRSVSDYDFDSALETLRGFGVVDSRIEHNQPVYCIRVPLFQNWLVKFHPAEFMIVPNKR